MTKRQVFFSFHYKRDSYRVARIRNTFKFSDDPKFVDNDWERIKKYNSKEAIKNWIDNQLQKRSCLVVLIGAETYTREWVQYEIIKAVELNKGIVGIYIHKLIGSNQQPDKEGKNPFDFIKLDNGEKLSKYVKCFNSSRNNSTDVYNDIKDNFSDLIEDAINNKPETWY